MSTARVVHFLAARNMLNLPSRSGEDCHPPGQRKVPGRPAVSCCPFIHGAMGVHADQIAQPGNLAQDFIWRAGEVQRCHSIVFPFPVCIDQKPVGQVTTARRRTPRGRRLQALGWGPSVMVHWQKGWQQHQSGPTDCRPDGRC